MINSIRSSMTGTTLAGQSSSASTVIRRPTDDQMAVLLFGKTPPRRLDKRRFPHLKKALRKLAHVAGEIAENLGASSEDFSPELCEGYNACITREGDILFGAELLEKHQDDDDLMMAILSHEIGHDPSHWPQGNMGRITKKIRDQIYRKEEDKADRFMGKQLADLGANPDPICKFLSRAKKFETHHSTEYYPAEVRADTIRTAFTARKRALKRRSQLVFGSPVRLRELR